MLRKVHEVRPALPVIVMTTYADLGNAVPAYERSAFEYLPKPFELGNAVSLVRHAASIARSNGEAASMPAAPELLGNAPVGSQNRAAGTGECCEAESHGKRALFLPPRACRAVLLVYFNTDVTRTVFP